MDTIPDNEMRELIDGYHFARLVPEEVQAALASWIAEALPDRLEEQLEPECLYQGGMHRQKLVKDWLKANGVTIPGPVQGCENEFGIPW